MRRAMNSSVCYQITMRAALALAALGLCSCMPRGTGGECHIDDDCGGSEVCARDQMCTASSSVRLVRATWTVQGMPASATTCGVHSDLFIRFTGSELADELAYAPVPCEIGQFTIDKLPDRYRQVELGIEGGFSDTETISSQNTAVLNVVF